MVRLLPRAVQQGVGASQPWPTHDADYPQNELELLFTKAAQVFLTQAAFGNQTRKDPDQDRVPVIVLVVDLLARLRRYASNFHSSAGSVIFATLLLVF